MSLRASMGLVPMHSATDRPSRVTGMLGPLIGGGGWELPDDQPVTNVTCVLCVPCQGMNSTDVACIVTKKDITVPMLDPRAPRLKVLEGFN